MGKLVLAANDVRITYMYWRYMYVTYKMGQKKSGCKIVKFHSVVL